MKRVDAKDLPIARYRFTLRAETPLLIREYPGSMLRGAFGHGLKAVSCMTDAPSCGACRLRESCRYPQLFEPLPGQAQRYRDLPAPYIIEAENDQNRQISAGEHWPFQMVLFGPAIEQLPVIIMAWQRAAAQGLGKGKARCRLETVEWQQPDDGGYRVVFHEHAPRIRAHEATLNLPGLPNVERVSIELLTPTRIQWRGKLCGSAELTAAPLLNGLARKIALYADCYWNQEWQRPVIPDDLELYVDTTLQRWRRYSNRQRKAMNLDGLVGKLHLEGSLANWLPWLWLGQYTHIGKNTSFGLGHYRLSI